MFLSSLIKLYSRLVADNVRRGCAALFPSLCILCRGPAIFYICLGCWQDLPSLAHCCQQCAQILPIKQQSSLKCGTCLKQKPHFDRTYALFPYVSPISDIIIKLKFQQKLHYAQALGKLLAAAIPDWYKIDALPDLIMPVPLHALRLRERGFNQALEIARPISKTLHLPIDKFGVRRTKPTLAQSSLPSLKRKQNMADAFTTQRRYTGKTIAIIDDVMTTGHTVSALSRLLKEQGAKRIDVWCCARR